MAPALGAAPSALGGDAPGAPLPGVGVGAKRPRSATPDRRRPPGSRPTRDDANARAPASDAPPSPPRPPPRGASPRTPSGDAAPPARLDARAQTSRPPPRGTLGEEEAAPSEGSDPSPRASDPRHLERDLDRAADAAGEDNLPGAARSEPPPSAASAPPDVNDADDPSTAYPRDDDSSSAPPLPAWLAADVDAALRFEPAIGAPGSSSAPGPPPARPGDPGWDHRSGAALSPAAFDAGEHGAEDAPEAFEVNPAADPCDVLRGRVVSAAKNDDDARGESVRDALSRRGAVKIAAPDAWDFEANASTLCDVRWLRDCGEKLGRLRGHFSLLQQTLPGRGASVARGGGGGVERGENLVSAAPTVTMSEDLSGKAAFNLTFGELVAESDRRFRAAAQPYSALGAEERERAFLRTLRARLPAKAPYLSSVALEALEERRLPTHKKTSKSRASAAYTPEEEPTTEGSNAPSADAPSKKQPPPPPPPRARPRWDPSLVADGRESILREMLDECERRCAPGAASREDEGGDAATKTKARRGGSATAADGAAFAAAAAAASIKNNLPLDLDLEGSVGGKKPATWGAGIISPWLYLTSVGSVFCCHIEDYAFGSANVILAPPGAHAWAAWYSVPRRDIGKLHEYLRGALGAEYALDCLEQRKLWLDPASVAAWRGPLGERIEVYRHLQGPGEYVATDYGAAHWGVNLGVGWKAAVNFAFGEWRAAAEGVHEQYRKLERATGLRRNYRSVPDFEGKEWEEEEEEELEELEGEEGRREGREGARALRLQVRRIRRVFREARRDEDDAVGKDDRDVDGGTEGPKAPLRPRERSRSRCAPRSRGAKSAALERGKPSPPPPPFSSNAPRGSSSSSKASKGRGRPPSSSAREKEKREIRPWTADELARLDGAIAEEEAAAFAAANVNENETAARGVSATSHSSSPGQKFAPGYSERVAERVGTRSARQVRDKLKNDRLYGKKRA